MKLAPDNVILRGIWAKAVAEGGLMLPAMSNAQAIRTRFLLFREAKAMRDEGRQGLVDSELLESMAMLTPRIHDIDAEHKQVSIESKGSMDVAELGRVLGIDPSATPGQEKTVEESLRRLHNLVEPHRLEVERLSFSTPTSVNVESKPTTALNPYFTRGGE